MALKPIRIVWPFTVNMLATGAAVHVPLNNAVPVAETSELW